VAFFAAQVATAWAIAGATEQSPATLIALSVILPAVVFFYLLAWAVHLHHTHPFVPWHATRADWSYFRGQVRCSVHMEFPRPVELFILNIMDHTAHHADPKIPLYELHDAQKRIEAAYPTEIIHEPFTLRGWLRLFRICRLYDYEHHQWLDWDGTPLTPPLLHRRSS
jgi:omega-6 fatty acid desaturase (delta-12 desaturase)